MRRFEGGSSWNDLIRGLPGAPVHVLQTEEWGAFKQRQTGWLPEKYIFADEIGRTVGAALVLTRRVGPLVVMYSPKGPLLDYTNLPQIEEALGHLQRLAQRRRAIQLKIDPDVLIGTGETGQPEATDHPSGQAVLALLRRQGWRFSEEQVQFRNTLTVDLTRSEEDILAAMGQGKRRKVRYGPRHGVTVRQATLDDLPMLYRLYAETGQRDGFLTRPYEYYIDEWGTMLRARLAHALVAEVGGAPAGHVILFHFGSTCWYFTGASVSDPELRKLMPSDLLQWEAMRWAKAQGYAVYDFYGAPNEFDESDRMWGVYQFKKDFGGLVARHVGAWDYAPVAPLYTLYTRLMPRLLDAMRRMRRHASH